VELGVKDEIGILRVGSTDERRGLDDEGLLNRAALNRGIGKERGQLRSNPSIELMMRIPKGERGGRRGERQLTPPDA
jgi:hypothetical protein